MLDSIQAWYLVNRFFLSLVATLVLMSGFISFSKVYGWAEKTRSWVKGASSKRGVPPMGGIVIVAVVSALSLKYVEGSKSIIAAYIAFATIGLIDDALKNFTKMKGMPALVKFILQIAVAAGYFYITGVSETTIKLPLIDYKFTLSYYWYLAFFITVIVGTSNSVNLTDGLDGLAGLSLIGPFIFIPIITHCGVSWIATIFLGSLFGFLRYNLYPAKVFMGDVGSLSSGALLALLYLKLGEELILPILGVVFVIETLSVMIQVISRVLFKKRPFLMAPLHHHYHESGMEESAVTFKFFAISLAAFCLMVIFQSGYFFN